MPIESLVLDSGILGAASHPRANRELAQWFSDLLLSPTEVIIAEIADYEVRRELIRADKRAGLRRLDQLKDTLTYLPLSTSIMLRAAELWAQARQNGVPTADPKELDCDVILAAQALEASAVVVTDNIGHLSRFVEAKRWAEIDVAPRADER